MPTSDPWSLLTTRRVRPASPDRFRFGVGLGVRLGVRSAVRLEPDPQTDTPPCPTTQVSSRASTDGPVPTDPCLGIPRWGSTPNGGAP